MRQYRNFPIYLNLNFFEPEERQQAYSKRLKDFHFSKDREKNMAKLKQEYGVNAWDVKVYEIQRAVRSTDKFLHEISNDPGNTGAYEDEIAKLLDGILKTRIGSLLIRSMKKSVKVWIVYPGMDLDAIAATTPGILPAASGGGVRLYFWPFNWTRSDRLNPDDVLFHELVHAYRAGWKDTKGMNHRPMTQYKTAEEFLAIHLQNVFLHETGMTKFYLSHIYNSVVSVDEVYQNIANGLDTMQVLAYFIYNEPLAREVAKWPDPPCNVWRDYALIRDRSPFKNSLPKAPRP